MSCDVIGCLGRQSLQALQQSSTSAVVIMPGWHQQVHFPNTSIPIFQADGHQPTLGTEPSVQLASLELSTDRPQAARLVIQPSNTVTEDIFIRSVGPSE